MIRTRHALRPCRFTVAIRWIGLSLMASACLFPFYAMIVLSLKSGTVELPGSLWPFSDVSLDSYRQVLSGQNLPRWLLNTVIYSVVIVLLVSALAGYAFAKKRFPGREVMFWTFLSMVMVPFQVTVIPTFMLISTWKGINTYWGMIVPTLANAQAVFLMRQFIHGLPDELFEAARVDGAGDFTIFWRIVLPLSRPILATLGLFVLLWHWNDFLWPLIVGRTTSRSCCHPEAPAMRALSSCEGGTADRAEENSCMEKAVPHQMLKTMMTVSGCSMSHALPGRWSSALSVPPRRSSRAIHRKETTEPGITHAASTTDSRRARAHPAMRRVDHARAKPMTDCPTTPDRATNSTVRRRELQKAGSRRVAR